MDGDEKPSAGWYQDPEYPGQLRYWDGEDWTAHRSPAPGTTPPPPGAATGDRTNAGLALAISILGFLLCQLLSPVGMTMGRNELTRIDSGLGDPGARGLAQAAYIIGIIGTVILVIAVLALIVFFTVVFAANS